MKRILITFPWGECDEQSCPFKYTCANHSSAGDMRTESGFTPEIFFEDEQSTFHCKTYSESIVYEPSGNYPSNCSNLGTGFVPIKTPKENNT